MSERPAGQPRPGTRTVDRSVAVLRSFEDADRQTPTEIARRAGLSVSTAHRIVHALHATGMLGLDPATDRYFLGPTAAILGRLALEGAPVGLLLPPRQRVLRLPRGGLRRRRLQGRRLVHPQRIGAAPSLVRGRLVLDSCP